MIWNDDHQLPEGLRTSQWKPGQVVEYTRTRFIPAFSYIGPATFEVGLYRDDERLPLSGPNAADRETTARAYKRRHARAAAAVGADPGEPPERVVRAGIRAGRPDG